MFQTKTLFVDLPLNDKHFQPNGTWPIVKPGT